MIAKTSLSLSETLGRREKLRLKSLEPVLEPFTDGNQVALSMAQGGRLASGDLAENGSIAVEVPTELVVDADLAKKCTITTSRSAWEELKLRALTLNGRLAMLSTIKSCSEPRNSLKLLQMKSQRPPQSPR